MTQKMNFHSLKDVSTDNASTFSSPSLNQPINQPPQSLDFRTDSKIV